MCEYCKDDGKIINGKEYDIFGIEMSTSMMLNTEDNEMVFMVGEDSTLITKIKYCPFCGRKLNTD